jgi:hypothetical protein
MNLTCYKTTRTCAYYQHYLFYNPPAWTFGFSEILEVYPTWTRGSKGGRIDIVRVFTSDKYNGGFDAFQASSKEQAEQVTAQLQNYLVSPEKESFILDTSTNWLFWIGFIFFTWFGIIYIRRGCFTPCNTLCPTPSEFSKYKVVPKKSKWPSYQSYR